MRNMKRKDITRRKDIERLVDDFYAKVRADETLAPVFTDVARVDWQRHLPLMYDFWENLLFHTGGYSGNPMQAHLRIHERQPLTDDHFNRWLLLFRQTLDERFAGDNTELAWQRAQSIATVMRIRMQS